MITRQDVAAQLERGMRVGFLMGTKDYRPLRSAFVREAPSDGAFETYADMGAVPWPALVAGKQGAMGTDTRTSAPIVNQMTEGGRIIILGGNERALIVYNLDWDVPIGIWHSAINDNRVGSLDAWARGAGANFEKHMDYLCFNALNSGEATTTYGAGYDGLSFFNDSHLDPGAEYQTAQDNKFALSLSLDNFETVYVAAAKLKDDRGQPMGLNHSLLIYPPDLARTAVQITDNEDAYDTANRELNPYKGKIRGLQAPGGWFDTTAWFLVDDSLPQKPIIMQVRQRPELVMWDDHTQGAGIRYYKWVARYAVAFGDWRLCVEGNS